MAIKNGIIEIVRNNYWAYRLYFAIRYELPSRLMGDEWNIKRHFKESMGFLPDLDHPKTLNEKLQWIKLHDRHEFNTLAADKLRVREFYRKTFGEEHIVPLIKYFQSWKDVTSKSLPDEPFVIVIFFDTLPFPSSQPTKSSIEYPLLSNLDVGLVNVNVSVSTV